jgi:hypothetical protein
MKATEARSQPNSSVNGLRITPKEKRVPDDIATIAIEHANTIQP